MEKKVKLIVTISLLTLVLVGLSLFISQKDDNQSSNQLTIATTIQPIASITEKISQNTNTKTINIVPSNTDPHSFEPTINDRTTLQSTDLVFSVGLDFDEWILDIAPNAQVVDLSKSIEIKDNNPHYWLSLENSKKIAFEVKNSLEKLNPQNKQIYETNYENLVKEVDLLTDVYKIRFSTLERKNIITYHPAFNYLLEDFSLNLITTIVKDEHSELTPTQLKEIKSLMNRFAISTIYVSNQTPEYITKSLRSTLDAKIVELDPLGSTDENKDYLNLIRYNLDKILENNE